MICCHCSRVLYVAVNVHLVVLWCCVRHRTPEITAQKECSLLFLFTAPVCSVICSLVRLNVSEISSVAPCSSVMPGTSQKLGGVAATSACLSPAFQSSMLCVKSVDSSGCCTCAVLVKRCW